MTTRTAVAAFAALFAASPAQATNGMRMIGFGASQVGMGGTSAALPLDAASVVTNPAGMTELGGRIDFGASFFNPSVSYQGQEIPGLPQSGIAVASTNKFDSERGASPVPAFGLVLPVTESLSFGIGAYGVAGMGVDYAQNLFGGVTYSSYSQMRFAPGIAYKINDLLSVGVTANVMYAQMGYDAAEGLLQVSHQAASAFGVGGTIGLRVTPMKGLAFGAAYETKSWFQDFKYNIPAHQPLDPSTGRPAVGPGGQPVILPAGVDSITFNQPSSVTVGVAWNAIEPLTLAADVQWIHWTESNGQNAPQYSSDITKTGAMPWNLNWTDQWVFKVGLQYRVVKELALRAGYNYGKMPLDPGRAFENIAFPAIAEHHITAGLGYDFTDRFAVNLAGMYVPEAKLSGSNPQQQYIASYQTSMSQYALDLGIAYRF
jgi:long-chain fatty acid transport protein